MVFTPFITEQLSGQYSQQSNDKNQSRNASAAEPDGEQQERRTV